MKTIIAEKPSVAREIARIVGATEREEGYFTGNGYNVTWAFGHLVQPALPEGYGIRGFHPEHLPIIPQVFTLVPQQVKTDKGYKADADRSCHKSIIIFGIIEGPQDIENGSQEYKLLKTNKFER